ncbi:MAG: type II toxin-antitoxin system RelE/ParE family toxin [Steroidobacteraceae bacterium]
MRTIHVHGSAESDLIDIRRYSFEQWGELQADKYLDELDSGIRKLANIPEIGMKRDYVRVGSPDPSLALCGKSSSRHANECIQPYCPAGIFAPYSIRRSRSAIIRGGASCGGINIEGTVPPGSKAELTSAPWLNNR